MNTNYFDQVLIGDCRSMLQSLPDGIVDTCVTSPPYYGLRDYGTGEWVGGEPNCPHRRTSKFSVKTITGHAQKELAGNVGDAIYKTICPLCGARRVDKQIGLEETPEEYIEELVQVFREVKRVLKDDGTLWVNIGDSYNFDKNLIGIPWMLAFALRSDGWYLRQDIIWHKPNPMPESVKDRCTKSHEYIFLFSKKPKYYFDHEAIQEEAKAEYEGRYKYEFMTGKQQEHFRPDGAVNTMGIKEYTGMRNKRDVWSVTTKPCKESHFAVFPEDLIEPCILAGCPVGGLVLDPFFGSGTTGRVAIKLNRHYIGIELNPEYVKISDKRTNNIQMTMVGLV